MTGTVVLDDLRCDGASHDGCMRGCRLFWKGAWLSDRPSIRAGDVHEDSTVLIRGRLKTREQDRYYCQSTELAGATSDIRQPDVVQLLGDVCLGEMSPWRFTRHALKAIVNRVRRLGVVHRDELRGVLRKTDPGSLDLRPGEWVEVKSPQDIEATLDPEGRNRGLIFDRVMLEYCGRRYQVARRVERIIQEETGRMVSLRNTVILHGAVCRSIGCPRANLLYWREIWLSRVVPPANSGNLAQGSSAITHRGGSQ
jgi:hypothetical protein